MTGHQLLYTIERLAKRHDWHLETKRSAHGTTHLWVFVTKRDGTRLRSVIPMTKGRDLARGTYQTILQDLEIKSLCTSSTSKKSKRSKRAIA
jgi:hypothetical protein